MSMTSQPMPLPDPTPGPMAGPMPGSMPGPMPRQPIRTPAVAARAFATSVRPTVRAVGERATRTPTDGARAATPLVAEALDAWYGASRAVKAVSVEFAPGEV